MTQIASQPTAQPVPVQPTPVQPATITGGTLVQPPAGAPNIPGLKWRAWPVKTTDQETKKQKVVGTVVVPEFDEDNPEAGIQQIAAYPWGDENLNGGAGYKDFKQAIVKLINTQHGTNVRNRLRQQHTGRVSSMEIKAEAMNRIPPAELQAAISAGGMAAVQLIDRYEKMVRDEMAAKRGGSGEADTQETADSEAATAVLGGGQA